MDVLGPGLWVRSKSDTVRANASRYGCCFAILTCSARLFCAATSPRKGTASFLTWVDMSSETTCAPSVAMDSITPERSSSSTPCHNTLPGALPGDWRGGLFLPPTRTFTESGASARSTLTTSTPRREAAFALLGCLETPRFRCWELRHHGRRSPLFPYAYATAVFGVPRDTPLSLLGVAPPRPPPPFSLRVRDGRFGVPRDTPLSLLGVAPPRPPEPPFSLRVRDGRFGGASRHPIFVVGSFFPYITPCRLLDAKRPLTFSLQVIPAAHPVTFSLPSLFSRRAFSFQ